MHIQCLNYLKNFQAIPRKALLPFYGRNERSGSQVSWPSSQGELELFAFSVYVISTSTYSPLNKGILISCIIPIAYSYKLHLKLILGDSSLILRKNSFNCQHPGSEKAEPPFPWSCHRIQLIFPRHSNGRINQKWGCIWKNPTDIMQRWPTLFTSEPEVFWVSTNS